MRPKMAARAPATGGRPSGGGRQAGRPRIGGWRGSAQRWMPVVEA